MFSKTLRQLAIFHIFLCSHVVEFEEITNLIEISHKTITRDIKELQNAGLINVRFSKKEKGYVHVDNHKHCPFSPPIISDNKAKNMHLEKLIRLATIMICLRGHTELTFYDEGFKNQETCSIWYKNKYPNVSTRTMERDFAELNKMGYFIEYDSLDKCYIVDFPDDINGLKSNLQYKYGDRKL